MADKAARDRAAYESAKLWMDQRKPKQTTSGSSFAPHTPPAQRSLSTFSSPGSILSREEDAVVIELTSRYLRAGIEGESGPQCEIRFGPESSRRVGDYRTWLPSYVRSQESLDTWGQTYELWKNDVVDLDLGLVSDILERTVREAYNKHLLVDAGTTRLVLVLPSLVPHPVLETILATLFQRWRYPSITLLPAPAMCAVSAGVRSALVIELGWEETVVTAIYEYREIGCFRTTRALKMLSQRVAVLLKSVIDLQQGDHSLRFDLDFVESFLSRALIVIDGRAPGNSVPTETSAVAHQNSSADDIEIDWPGQPSSRSVKIPKTDIETVLLETLFDQQGDTYADDHEVPIHQLIFKALLSLSPEVRGVCMSRLVFTGTGMESALLRTHIRQNVESLIKNVGWSAVKGQHVKAPRVGLSEIAQGRAAPSDAKFDVQLPAGKDYVEERLQIQKAKFTQPSTQGHLREVHTLGPWAGASLLSALKIRGFVEIERERFLSHGLHGASRDTEISVIPSQRMSSFGLPTPGRPADRSSWTLSGWA